LAFASRASFISRRCSISLTIAMYHEPIDMMIRMMSVPRATKSPWRQSASMP
jgi:hypothetical protein